MSESITIQESNRLVELEGKIKSGLETFIEVGEALFEIKKDRLYRIEHETFESYCLSKWKFTKTQANRLIGAAAVSKNLAPIGVTPQTESQARPLTGLQAKQQVVVWEKAVEKADGGQPTAKHVQEAVVEVLEPAPFVPKYTPALGLQIADNAIRVLETITAKDSDRKAGLEKVISYCNRQLKK